MIRLKLLIKESMESLVPSMVYNFYFLWHLYLTQPGLFQSDYGEFVLEEYTSRFKKVCINIFKKLVYNQIIKYVNRNRVDIDFPKGQPTESTSSKDLLLLMKKTFRSDMKRRNTRWESVAEYVVNLESSNLPKDIFIWVDRLFNATHNTETKVLDKVTNYYSELSKAFDTAHNHDPQYWQQYVDKDLRQLTSQSNITENKYKKLKKK